jgi:hypothetical protein
MTRSNVEGGDLAVVYDLCQHFPGGEQNVKEPRSLQPILDWSLNIDHRYYEAEGVPTSMQCAVCSVLLWKRVPGLSQATLRNRKYARIKRASASLTCNSRLFQRLANDQFYVLSDVPRSIWLVDGCSQACRREANAQLDVARKFNSHC